MPFWASPLQPDAAKPEPRSAEAAAEIAKALSGNALGHSEEGFWGTFGSLEALLGHSWATLGGSLRPLGALRECCWGLFGTPWDSLGSSWDPFVLSCGTFGTHLGGYVPPRGSFWGALGSVILDTFGRLCGHFWRDVAKLRKNKDFLGFP